MNMLQYGQQDASFQAAGGYEGVRQLVDDFYQIMDEHTDAVAVRRLHAEDLSSARDQLTRFLCGCYGKINLPSFHAHWSIDEAERDAWLNCMAGALERQPWSAEFKAYLFQQLRVPAERVMQASQATRRS
jgi:hemoglobin